jgi:hypothetical protein
VLSVMRVVERRVPPALAPYVRSLASYACYVPHARERIMPSGGIQLLVNAHDDEFLDCDGAGPDTRMRRVPGAAVQGPQFGPTIIDTSRPTTRRTIQVWLSPSAHSIAERWSQPLWTGWARRRNASSAGSPTRSA